MFVFILELRDKPSLTRVISAFSSRFAQRSLTMVLAFRHKMEIFLLIFLSFIAFASAASPTTIWVQWTTLAIIVFFALLFDLSFTDDSSFVFDPDADNWRRKTER